MMEGEQRRPLVRFDAEDLGHGTHVVLPRLTLALHEGERVALLGQSGAGKSTLLGELRRRLGRQAAWCPQHHGLVPQLAVYHNVFMGRLPEHSALANLWNLVRPLRRPWQEVAALHQRELALTHFDRVWGLRDGRLALDAPAAALTLAELDALYPDADAPSASLTPDSDAATPPSVESLPCARGRP